MTIQRKSTTFQSPQFESDSAAEDLPTFDLSDFLRVLRTHKKIIFGTAALVIAITAFSISRLTPLYTATAYVLLDQKQNNVVNANAIVSDLPTDPSSIENQVQILRSRNLAGRVVDTLKLVNDPDFNGAGDNTSPSWTFWINPNHWVSAKASAPDAAPQPADLKNALINKLLADLTVTAQGRSTAIAISFELEDADKASLLANAVAEAYVDDQLNAKFEATQKASQWLSERLQQVSAQTQASERAVEQYKTANSLTDSATPGTSIIQQQLSALNLQLISAQADLAQQEAKYGQVTAMRQSGHAADVSQVVASSLISQLRQQEAELLRQEAELSSRYGPRHPKVLDLESQKQNLSTKIDEEVQRVVETVGSDVAVARARLRSLQDSLSHITSQSQDENLARVKLSELASSATSNRALYDAFLNRFKEIQGQDAIQTPEARVISPATTPKSPSFPNKIIFLGAAVPGGLMLGILLALLSASLESGFRTREQVERAMSLPVLAALPEITRSRRAWKSAADCVVKRPLSAFSEGVRGLQLGLVICNGDKQPKTVLITSAVPAEGKTTVAVSLARIAARTGQRVILLDADFRQPGVGKTISVLPSQSGITDVLNGKAVLEDCLVKDPISDMLFLPSVGRVTNPSDLLASDEMADLIATLSASCDLLIIDSSPLLPVNDARILARLADAVVFVVRWERTPRAASLEALRSLTDVMAPLAGIVLARADKGQFQYHNYGKKTYRSFNKYYRD